MSRALELGRQALGLSSPNPAVGAVIVLDGEIIGEGYTQPPGGRHAEIVALALRVIADSNGRTPPTARLFGEPGQTLVATASAEACAPFEALGENVTASAFPASNGRVDLVALLRHLGHLGAVQVMTEAGEQLLGAFFEEGLVDQAEIHIAPVIIGGNDAPGPVGGDGVEVVRDAHRFLSLDVDRVGEDIVARGILRYWQGGTD